MNCGDIHNIWRKATERWVQLQGGFERHCVRPYSKQGVSQWGRSKKNEKSSSNGIANMRSRTCLQSKYHKHSIRFPFTSLFAMCCVLKKNVLQVLPVFHEMWKGKQKSVAIVCVHTLIVLLNWTSVMCIRRGVKGKTFYTRYASKFVANDAFIPLKPPTWKHYLQRECEQWVSEWLHSGYTQITRQRFMKLRAWSLWAGTDWNDFSTTREMDWSRERTPSLTYHVFFHIPMYSEEGSLRWFL